MRAYLVLLTLVVLILPIGLAASPDLVHPPKTADVQKLVDTILGVKEAKTAFEEGDTLVVSVGDKSWNGRVAAGAIQMREGFERGSTHYIGVDRGAMLSIMNAYDPTNTMKLAVKRQYLTAESQRASVNTAIGAIARTPLDERLPTYDPKGGDNITFQNCSGTLGPRDDGQFFVKLCDGRYIVDTLGGVTAKLPAEHLEKPPPLKTTMISVTQSMTLTRTTILTVGEIAAYSHSYCTLLVAQRCMLTHILTFPPGAVPRGS